MNPIRLVPLAALFCLGLLCGACSQTDREETGETTLSPYPPVVDAYGDTVHIDKRPERIISLAPNITEIIYFLGAEARLIARTDYCDYPPAAAELPSIDRDVKRDSGVIGRLARALGGKTLFSERLMLDGLVAVWHPDLRS